MIAAKPPKYLRYGASVNRYDALKLLALAAMTLDHLAAFLWSDQLWMRAIGHAFPQFFLLIGWSRNTRFSFRVMDLAIVLSIAAWALGQDVLPLNILYTVTISRLALGLAERHGWLEHGQGKLLAIGIFWLPLAALVDYGSSAILWMLVGRNIRDGRDGWMPRLVVLVALAYHLVTQSLMFEGEPWLMALHAAVFGAILWLVMRWLRQDPRRPAPNWLNLPPLRFIARHSLEYYTLHLLAIWGVAAISPLP